MKNSDLNALLKECCLELGIEWVDEPGPAVIDGQKADEYFKDHTIFPDTKDIALVLEYPDGNDGNEMDSDLPVDILVDTTDEFLKAA